VSTFTWNRCPVSSGIRSRDAKGYGYALEWRALRHRVHGSNPVPVTAVVPSEADALRLIGKAREAARFAALVADTEARHPQLRPWLARRPLTALEHAADWDRLLAVIDWFRAHPRPDLYLRQVDIPGVHTKAISIKEPPRLLVLSPVFCVAPAVT
jgi:hypothetical protein